MKMNNKSPKKKILEDFYLKVKAIADGNRPSTQNQRN